MDGRNDSMITTGNNDNMVISMPSPYNYNVGAALSSSNRVASSTVC
jgi:hypothetical protein